MRTYIRNVRTSKYGTCLSAYLPNLSYHAPAMPAHAKIETRTLVDVCVCVSVLIPDTRAGRNCALVGR